MMFRKIFNIIKHLCIGHFTIFKHSFKKRVTLEYPEKRPTIPERFRGKHAWNGEKCVACKMCEKVCPANAIHINKTDDNIEFNIELAKCIFCGNCKYYCPKQAIEMTNKFELATTNKDDLNFKSDSNNQSKG